MPLTKLQREDINISTAFFFYEMPEGPQGLINKLAELQTAIADEKSNNPLVNFIKKPETILKGLEYHNPITVAEVQQYIFLYYVWYIQYKYKAITKSELTTSLEEKEAEEFDPEKWLAQINPQLLDDFTKSLSITEWFTKTNTISALTPLHASFSDFISTLENFLKQSSSGFESKRVMVVDNIGLETFTHWDINVPGQRIFTAAILEVPQAIDAKHEVKEVEEKKHNVSPEQSQNNVELAEELPIGLVTVEDEPYSLIEDMDVTFLEEGLNLPSHVVQAASAPPQQLISSAIASSTAISLAPNALSSVPSWLPSQPSPPPAFAVPRLDLNIIVNLKTHTETHTILNFKPYPDGFDREYEYFGWQLRQRIKDDAPEIAEQKAKKIVTAYIQEHLKSQSLAYTEEVLNRALPSPSVNQYTSLSELDVSMLQYDEDFSQLVFFPPPAENSSTHPSLGDQKEPLLPPSNASSPVDYSNENSQNTTFFIPDVQASNQINIPINFNSPGMVLLTYQYYFNLIITAPLEWLMTAEGTQAYSSLLAVISSLTEQQVLVFTSEPIQILLENQKITWEQALELNCNVAKILKENFYFKSVFNDTSLLFTLNNVPEKYTQCIISPLITKLLAQEIISFDLLPQLYETLFLLRNNFYYDLVRKTATIPDELFPVTPKERKILLNEMIITLIKNQKITIGGAKKLDEQGYKFYSNPLVVRGFLKNYRIVEFTQLYAAVNSETNLQNLWKNKIISAEQIIHLSDETMYIIEANRAYAEMLDLQAQQEPIQDVSFLVWTYNLYIRLCGIYNRNSTLINNNADTIPLLQEQFEVICKNERFDKDVLLTQVLKYVLRNVASDLRKNFSTVNSTECNNLLTRISATEANPNYTWIDCFNYMKECREHYTKNQNHEPTTFIEKISTSVNKLNFFAAPGAKQFWEKVDNILPFNQPPSVEPQFKKVKHQ